MECAAWIGEHLQAVEFFFSRFGIGVELKPSYYRQAVKNLKAAAIEAEQGTLFAGLDIAS